MKRPHLSTIAAAIFFSFAVCVSAHAATYTLAAVTGDVSVRMTAKGAWEAAKNGVRLEKGAAVRSMKGSSAVLKSGNGNSLKLFPLSIIEIGQLEATPKGGEKARIDITSGRIAASVKKVSGSDSNFSIKTPTAVAGVRGTDFFAEVSENGNSSFGVTEGEIEVGVGGVDTILGQDFTISVTPSGEVSEPAAMPEEVKNEINDALKEAKETPTPEQENTSSTTTTEQQKEEEAATDTGAADATDSVTETLNVQTVQDISDNAIDAGEAAIKSGTVNVDIYIGQQPQ